MIFIDEATQLSERAFRYLQGCIRGVNNFSKRMYLSCNPGGIGHRWVKRYFIDRDYKRDPDPEKDENPADYTFIFATAEDNIWLQESSPMYMKQLMSMPEDQRRAFRYGDWDAMGGSYFKNFSASSHVVEPFSVPKTWPIYRSFDYGLDMLAVAWWAVDEDGRSWCIRYFEQANLDVQTAARAIVDNTKPTEDVQITYAPWDMWARQKVTGKTIAEIFMLSGVPIVKSDNNRVQGHMIMKDLLSPLPLRDPYVKSLYKGADIPEALPALMFFSTAKKLIADINDIQADAANPNDCAKVPHDVTHSVDAARYYCISRVLAAEAVRHGTEEEDEEEEQEEPYEDYMCGGEVGEIYIAY